MTDNEERRAAREVRAAERLGLDERDLRRIAILSDAMEHQYDADDNADLVMVTDDPILAAAVRIVNTFGGWHEISIAPYTEFIALLKMARGET